MLGIATAVEFPCSNNNSKGSSTSSFGIRALGRRSQESPLQEGLTETTGRGSTDIGRGGWDKKAVTMLGLGVGG